MQTFNLPADDDSDDGMPASITHGSDYMLSGPQSLEFYYNYLNYSWVVGGEAVTARSYLDEIDEITVFVGAEKLEQAAFAPLLRYLQRRYKIIKTIADGGYQVRYKRQTR
jgi:hypothetical protein